MKTFLDLASAFLIFLTGCYSESLLTRGEAVPDDVAVYYYLQNGAHVKSAAGQHVRVDGGYQVTGEIRFPAGRGNKFEDKKTDLPFAGRIPDGDIKEVGRESFDWLKTTVAVAIPVAVLVYLGTNFEISPDF